MKTIAIVGGGDSSEYLISLKSAKEVEKKIKSQYNVYLITIRGSQWYYEDSNGKHYYIDKNDFSLTIDNKKITFDAVFNAIHGTPGENGLLQGYFDMISIPYTGCNAYCSALTFNKQACKSYLKEFDIRMAEAIYLRKGGRFDINKIAKSVGLPCFVKPTDSGSSFGVSKVNNIDEMMPAIETAFRESNEIMIESYMKGREVACSVFKTPDRQKSIVFPITEIISKNDFFDYEAKYTPGLAEEVTPAKLEEQLSDKIWEQSSLIYDLLGCAGIVRIDFIIVGEEPYFLEINTIPGMTQESLMPKQAAAVGIDLSELYAEAINIALG